MAQFVFSLEEMSDQNQQNVIFSDMPYQIIMTGAWTCTIFKHYSFHHTGRQKKSHFKPFPHIHCSPELLWEQKCPENKGLLESVYFLIAPLCTDFIKARTVNSELEKGCSVSWSLLSLLRHYPRSSQREYFQQQNWHGYFTTVFKCDRGQVWAESSSLKSKKYFILIPCKWHWDSVSNLWSLQY